MLYFFSLLPNIKRTGAQVSNSQTQLGHLKLSVSCSPLFFLEESLVSSRGYFQATRPLEYTARVPLFILSCPKIMVVHTQILKSSFKDIISFPILCRHNFLISLWMLGKVYNRSNISPIKEELKIFSLRAELLSLIVHL